MIKTWYVGGRHCFNASNKIEYEKLNPETHKSVKIIKGKCSVWERNKSQIFNK